MIVAAIPFALRSNQVLSSEIDLLPGSASQEVSALLKEHFVLSDVFQVILIGEESATPPRVQPKRPSEDVASVSEEADRSVTQLEAPSFIDALTELPEITSIQALLDTDGRPLTTTEGLEISIINLSASSILDARNSIPIIKTYIKSQTDETYLLTGGQALEEEIIHLGEKDARRAERIGIPLSLIVLAIAFGAVVATLLPILVAICAIILAFGILFGIGHTMSVATYAQVVVSMLGLATGIDYALLMVNRFREELKQSNSVAEAVRTTSETAGQAVVSSGLTVMIALVSLVLSPSVFIRSLGIAAVVVLICSVLISRTLLPALFSLLGHNVNGIRLRKGEIGKRSFLFWQNWSKRVLKAPWFWAGLGLAILIILSLPIATIKLSVLGNQGISTTTDSGKAIDLLEASELDSLLSDYTALIDFGERGFFHPKSVNTVSKITRQLEALPEIQYIVSPTRIPSLPSLLVQQYYARQDVALQSPMAALVRSNISKDEQGRFVKLELFPSTTLTDKEKKAFVNTLKTAANELDLTVYVGGKIISEQDWTAGIYKNFHWVVFFVYLATFIMLGLVFRSLLIPLKSIVLNTFTVTASLGIMTAIFQWGWGINLFGLTEGLGAIESSIPLFVFAVVFGISMDYEVFLVARIFEAHNKGMTDREAVVYALSRTGSVISNAAIIMVIVFSVFIFSSILFIKMLSLGLAVAVFLDATLVRLMLVPAFMVLAGRWNWYFPEPLKRISERIGLEHK